MSQTPAPVDPATAQAIVALANGGTQQVGPPRGTVLDSKAVRNADGSVTTTFTRADGGGGTYTTQEISPAPFVAPQQPQNPPASTTSPLTRAEVEQGAAAQGGTIVDRGGILVVTWPDGSQTRFDPSRTTPTGDIGYNPTYYPPPASSTSKSVSLGYKGQALSSAAPNQLGVDTGANTTRGSANSNDLINYILGTSGAGANASQGGLNSLGQTYTPANLASDLARHNQLQTQSGLEPFRIPSSGDPVKDTATLGAVQGQIQNYMDSGMSQGEAITAIQQQAMNPVTQDPYSGAYTPVNQQVVRGIGGSPDTNTSSGRVFAQGGGLRLNEPVMGIGMMSHQPLFMAAEAGRQENVTATQGGLHFDPTRQPIRYAAGGDYPPDPNVANDYVTSQGIDPTAGGGGLGGLTTANRNARAENAGLTAAQSPYGLNGPSPYPMSDNPAEPGAHTRDQLIARYGIDGYIRWQNAFGETGKATMLNQLEQERLINSAFANGTSWLPGGGGGGGGGGGSTSGGGGLQTSAGGGGMNVPMRTVGGYGTGLVAPWVDGSGTPRPVSLAQPQAMGAAGQVPTQADWLATLGNLNSAYFG